jgi:hypothetical protein
MASFRVAAVTLTVSAGLIAAGCGASSALSPTGPSAGAGITTGILASEDGSAFTAERKGEDKGKGDNEHGPGGEAPQSRGVKVNGRITALDVATRTVTVGEKKVNIPVTAVIRHGSRTFTFADLQLGDHIQVKGSTNAAGIVVADEVKVEQGGNGDGDDEDDDDDANLVETSGTVGALTGTCPALTFNILTTKITTTATTAFHGLTCAALAHGDVVEVKGVKQADGSIVATRVLMETDVKGAVSALTGTCPALTFNVGTTKVTTSATTVFHGITCATVANGAIVEVEGTKQADASILATRVAKED